MMNVSCRERTKDLLYRLAAPLTILAIGLPGIFVAFANEIPTRWLTALVVGMFFGINLVYHLLGWGNDVRLSTVYMVVGTAFTIALFLLNPKLSFYVIVFYVLGTEGMMCFSRRTGYLWLGFFALLTVGLLLWAVEPLEAAITIPIYLGGFFFFATFANATYQANQARQETQALYTELQAAHLRLREYVAQAEALALAQERNRLAREMHDTLGHRLTVAAVQLEGAQRLIEKNPARAANMVETVREQVRAALNELRQTVATLREPLEADLPLATSLEQLAAAFEVATGLTVHLLLPEELPPLSNALRLALYRTAQEGLTNVQRHAAATQVWVQLHVLDGLITLRVGDNGAGLPAQIPENSFGLRGLRERAGQLGGQFTAEARPGGGGQISMKLPLAGVPADG